MRRRQWLAAVLLLTLLVSLGGCGRGQEAQQSELVLYFLTDSGIGHGCALGTQSCSLAAPDVDQLLAALFAGPTQEGLTSPFPSGVAVRSWEWDTEVEGNVKLRLSEQYSGLTDISMTLADYCIVLTLTQLEGVESVEISSSGYSANYRSHQILRPEEAMLFTST
jgi:spore germination protein GerM